MFSSVGDELSMYFGSKGACVYFAQICRLLPDQTLVCAVLSLVYETHLPAFCRPSPDQVKPRIPIYH